MKKKKKTILVSVLLLLIIGLYLYLQVEKGPITTLYVENISALKDGRMTVEEARQFYHNASIMGSINIKGTSIHHFFVQADDNTFYLNHDLKKRESPLGTIFMDYRNTVHDQQINLYGHNGNHPNAPFFDLSKYKDKAFFEAFPIIEVNMGGDKKTYEIGYVLITQEKEHMNLMLTEEKIQFFTENALYKTNTNIAKEDSVLVLQTCTYEKKNAYLLVVAKEKKGKNV